MLEVKYTDKESAYGLVSVGGTADGGLGIATWAQKTATGYVGGSKRYTNVLFTADEIASGAAVDAKLVRARLDDFFRTNPIDTGTFSGDKHTFF